MSKKEVDSILLANRYFTLCKCSEPKCHKTELARKYLSSKIRRVLYPKRFSSIKSIYLSLIAILIH